MHGGTAIVSVFTGEESGAWGRWKICPESSSWWWAELRAWQSGSRVHMCHCYTPLSLDGFFHRNYLHICWMELVPGCLGIISPCENGCLPFLGYSLSSCIPMSSLRYSYLDPTPFLSVFLCSLLSWRTVIFWETFPTQPIVHSLASSISPSLTSLVPVDAQWVVTG